MHRTGRAHRPVAALAVLALVATLLVALPTALPQVGGGLSLAPSADAVPPVDKPLPPCEDDENGDPEPWCDQQWTSVSPCPDPSRVTTGTFCNVPGSSVGIVVSGDIRGGGSYQVTAVPGLPACAGDEQTGCYEDISSGGHSGTCVWWEGEEIRSSSYRCDRYIVDRRAVSGVEDFRGTAPARPIGMGLTSTGCGQNYDANFPGGGAFINPRWEGYKFKHDGNPGYPELVAQALTCTVRPVLSSWDHLNNRSERPLVIDQLPGPFWLTAAVRMSERTGPGRPNKQHYATALIPVRGDLRDSGPRARFEYEQLGSDSGTYSFTSTSYHPAGEGMTHAWRAEWWGPEDEYELQEDSGPSALFTFDKPGWWEVELEVTDTDGETDRAYDSVRIAGVRAAFDVTELEEHGAFQFTDDSSTVGERVIESWEWDLGDDTTSTVRSPTHTYDEPGTYDVSLTVTDDGGDSATATTTVEVVATELDGDWIAADGAGGDPVIREDETSRVRLRVDNPTRKDLVELEITEASIEPVEQDAEQTPAHAEGEGADDPTLAITPATDGLSADTTLSATGPASVTFQDYDVEHAQAGDVRLLARVRAVDATSGEEVTGEIEEVVTVRGEPIDVDVELDLRREDGSKFELNTDNDGDGDVDEDDHRFPATITISNTTDEPITDVRYLDETEPIDWSNNLVGDDHGAPKLTFRGENDSDGSDPDDLTTVLEPLPDLAPSGTEGDSHEVTLWYEATGEVDAEGQVVVLGAQGDDTVRGSAETEAEIVSGILLEFSSWLKEPDRLTTSGQVVRIGGYLENLDEDETDDSGAVVREARPIAVWITPMVEGNAGGGHLVTRDGGRTPVGAEFIEVAPGERVDLHGILATLASPHRTDAEVRYLVNAWQVPTDAGDTALAIADERIDLVVDEDKGWGDEHSQRLRFADLSPDDITACETHLYDAIVTCNFYEGLKSLYFNAADAHRMAEQGIGEIGSSTYWVGAWAMHQLGDAAAALNDDPAAKQRLAAELEVQLETWKQLGILSVDTGVSAVGVLDQFISETDRVIREGDTEAGLAWVSKFAGENPDMLFAGILKARTLTSMGQSVLRDGTESAAGAIVRESVEAEARAAQQAINRSVDDAINRAADPKMPSSGALRSGLDITDSPKVWRDVYGASRSDMDAFLQIAREEGILIAFRSRSPISIKMLEDGLAWLKPQSVKAKNVNAIDVAYGGFPQDSLGKVVMVEPPIDFRLKGDALEDALDAHMAKLKESHPELVDDVWADEVRDRIKMRAEKFEEHLAEWLDYAANGMPVGFDGAANNVRTGNLNVTEVRDARIEVVKVPDPYNPDRQLTRIDLKIAGPDGGDYRHLSGDIDVVGFFNLDRTPIMGSAKRDRIYQKMRGAGMQHGETLTWDHKKRAELLREHVGADAELLVVAGPNDKVHLSALDETKSSEVFDGDNFANTFSLLDGPPVELKSPNRPPGPLPSGALVRKVATTPRTIQAMEHFKKPADIVDRLKKVAEQSGGQIVVEDEQSKDGPAVVIRPDGTMVIYRLPTDGSIAAPTRASTGPEIPGPGLQMATTGVLAAPALDPDAIAAQQAIRDVEALLGDYRRTFPRPAEGRLGGTWQEIDFAAAAGLGDATRFELPLTTWTDVPVEHGDTTISVLQAEELGVPGGDWFAAGDRVVFDPGGAYEQVLTLTSVDGHRLAFAGADALLPDEGAEIEVPEGVQVLFLPASTSTSRPPDGADAGGGDGEPVRGDGDPADGSQAGGGGSTDGGGSAGEGTSRATGSDDAAAAADDGVAAPDGGGVSVEGRWRDRDELSQPAADDPAPDDAAGADGTQPPGGSDDPPRPGDDDAGPVAAPTPDDQSPTRRLRLIALASMLLALGAGVTVRARRSG